MISINNLVKTFGTTRAVDGVSFNVNQGEVLGFLGPNGAGKTTTMKVIAGFFEPDSGSVSVAGLDVVKDSLQARRHIGYLPETVPLYDDMKVYEYLKFVAEIRDLDRANLLPRLKEVVAKCGLQTVIGKSVDELSKGFRQRLGLAQAIIHNPDILILDEPTSGLDPNQIVEIRELIKQLGREKTVLFSTHILAEAEATCDRIVIINKGKIVGEGRPDELAARGGDSVWHLRVKGEPTAVLETLRQVEGVKSLEQLTRETDLLSCRLEFIDGSQAHQTISLLLAARGWSILELSRTQTSLEEVFKELTT